MKAWFLFFIGTLAYFLYKYINRGSKQSSFSIVFWLKDNWPELVLSFLFDLAAVLILLDPNTAIDLAKITWMPAWLSFSAELFGAFFFGFGGGVIIYAVFKKKIKYSKE